MPLASRVDWMFWDESFVIEVVSDEFYEYWSGADLLEDGYGSFAPLERDGTVWFAAPALEEAELLHGLAVRRAHLPPRRDRCTAGHAAWGIGTLGIGHEASGMRHWA